jgi:hypothetical protein
MRILVAIIFVSLLYCCSPNNYENKVSISNNEYKLLKKYIKNHRNILKDINVNKYYISSNNKGLLVKMKMRLMGIDCLYRSHGPITPIIIKYQNRHYYAYIIDDEDVNWMDDEDIYEKLYPENISPIDIDISDKLLNLNKEEFIEEYFLEDEDGMYKSKVNMNYTLFEERNIENDKLFNEIMVLSIVEYNLLVKLMRGHIYIMEM